MLVKQKKLADLVVPLACAGSLYVGCGGAVEDMVSASANHSTTQNGTNAQMEEIPGFGPAVTSSSSGLTYHVVARESFDSIPFDEVLEMEPGTPMTILLNRHGTEVRAYTVEFQAALKDGAERLIIARMPDELIVGAGDSGSPLLTQDGRIVGLLCYGWSFNNHQFAARAIADVTAVPANGRLPSGLNKAPGRSQNARTIPLAYHTTGFRKDIIERLDADNRYRDFLLQAIETSVKGTGGMRRGLSRRTAAGACDDDSVVLAPGMSIALHELTGDLVNFAAVGVAGYIDGSVLYAFGHGYWMVGGELNKPITLASMETIIESQYEAFKLTSILDQHVGRLVGDHPHGIVIDTDERPGTIGLTVTTSVDGGGEMTTRHRISHDSDPYWENTLMFNALYASVLHPMGYSYSRGWAEADISLSTEQGCIDTTMRIPDIDTSRLSEKLVQCYSAYDSLADSVVMVCDSTSYEERFDGYSGSSCEWDRNSADIAGSCVFGTHGYIVNETTYSANALIDVEVSFRIYLDTEPCDDTCMAGWHYSSY